MTIYKFRELFEIFWIIFQIVKIKIRNLNILFIIINYSKKYEKFYKLLDQLSLHHRTNFHPISYVPFTSNRAIFILDACTREHNSRRIPKHTFECIFPRMRASHSEWQKPGSKGWIRMGRFESNAPRTKDTH